MSGVPRRFEVRSDIPKGISDVIEGLIAHLARQCGYQFIERSCVSTLTNLYISFVESVASNSLSYAETANRTKIVLHDVVFALIDMGVNVRKLTIPTIRPLARCIPAPPELGQHASGVATKSVMGPSGEEIFSSIASLRTDSATAAPGVAAMGNVANSAATAVINAPKAPAHLHLPPLPEAYAFVETRVTRPPPAPTMAALRRQNVVQQRHIQVALAKLLAKSAHSSSQVSVHHLFPADESGGGENETREDASVCSVVLLPAASNRPYVEALLADSLPDAARESLSDSSKPSKASAVQPSESRPPNYFLAKPIFPSADLNHHPFI